MPNPYASPSSSTTQRVPTVRQVSRLAAIPQLLALMAAIAVGWYVTRSTIGVYLGAAAYLIYAFGARLFIPRAHRRGVRLSTTHRFAEAIEAHQESYDFFTRHAWIDRYRSIVMMSPSAMSYREMALINIAFAYSQIGDGQKAKEYYQRAQQEFPESAMAATALRMIEAIERSHAAPEDVS